MLTWFGLIISNSIKMWKEVKKKTGATVKYCEFTSIWHNNNLCTANKQFVFKPWAKSGIFTLKHLYNADGLKSFQILKDEFSIPESSFFLYLRLRSAMKAYGVPWSAKLFLPPMIKWIDSSMTSKGSVSKLNELMVVHQYAKILIESYWERELNITIDWDNCFASSKNPVHQMINFKQIYKACTTPWLL